MIKSYFKKLIDWLFPFYCTSCKQEGRAICKPCLAKIKLFRNEFCCYCQLPNKFGKNCDGCGLLDGLWAIFEYEKKGILSEILHNWKYNQIEAFWQDFRTEINIADKLRVWLEKNFDLVTWIPLSERKLQLRGFNQSEFIAKQIGLKLPQKAIVIKKLETVAQMTLSKAERHNNLKDVFEVVELGQGRKIILIDDISTTKATLEEAAKALKAAGWAKVYGLVLARQSIDDSL